MTIFTDQLARARSGPGFIAALDQSGGSTPGALKRYGIDDSQYANDADMFRIVHEMRSRIITNPAFTGDRILGAILFENTMEREVEGQATSNYLWSEKQVIPFLKIDKGLEDEAAGVRLMKPNPGLDELLSRAKRHNVFGTKMRSVIMSADADGIRRIVEQQFETANQIAAQGLVPIIEPEIDIGAKDKSESEQILKELLLDRLNGQSDPIIFKLTLPETPDHYAELGEHDSVLKVAALSGGYSREEANKRLTSNHRMIASFSRALTEGLRADQSDEAFTALLDATIESIFRASSS